MLRHNPAGKQLPAEPDRRSGDGRPVILFQHYGWDAFSTEVWDAAARTFDDQGDGPPHWWSPGERQELVDAIKGHNVIGLFHGHQHETAMIYRREGLDLFKPKAAYMGGFALVCVTDGFMDVVLAGLRRVTARSFSRTRSANGFRARFDFSESQIRKSVEI